MYAMHANDKLSNLELQVAENRDIHLLLVSSNSC